MGAEFAYLGTMEQGEFTDVSDILPSSLSGGVHGAVGDYDNDGDLDLFLG